MEKTSDRTNITVSLRDMFLYVCSRWRVLIIWLIIGAVLGGAYSGYKSIKDGTASGKDAALAIYNGMSETDKTNVRNNVTTFTHYINMFDFYSTYDEKSLFQKLNPDTAKVGVLTYDIEPTDENDTLESAVRAYAASIIDDRFAEDVAGAFGVSEEDAFYYYDGIVRVGDSIVMKYKEGEKYTELLEVVQAPLIIRVYGEDDEFVTKMSELVKASVDRVSADIGRSGSHQAALISETIKRNDDTYIFDRQEAYVANIIEVITSSNELAESLEPGMLATVRYFVTEEYEGEYLDFVFPGQSYETAPSLHISKKWLLLGAAGFFILALIVIIIKYLVKGVVRCYDDIEYTYGIQVLGTFDDPKTALKEHKLRIDKWLKSLRIKRKSQGREESAKLLAMKLKLVAKNNEINDLCVAIGPDVDTDIGFVEEVAGQVDGVNVTVASNILRSADAISKVLDAEGVVLLEQKDRSRFSSIDEERVMCAGNNIRILGAIVAE